MLRSVLVATLCLITGSIYAQDHYLTIRSDDSQPFLVRVGEQTYQSNANGNLTISGIRDNTVSLIISFPDGKYADQNFSIVMKADEMHFVLKKADADRWMLKTESQAGNDEKKQPLYPAGSKKQDPFSILMAGVVNDTAVLYNTAMPEEPVKDTVQLAKTVVTASPATTGVAKNTAKNTTAKKGQASVPVLKNTPKTTVAAAIIPPPKKTKDTIPAASNNSQAWIPGIFKVYEKRLGTALKMIYVDVSEQGKIDSVDMQIVYEAYDTSDASAAKTQTVIPLKEQGNSTNTVADSQKMTNQKTDTSLVTGNSAIPKAPVVVAKENTSRRTDSAVQMVRTDAPKKTDSIAGKKPLINSNCRLLATEYDEDKIRVKMMSQPNDDDKVTEARKFFKLKCYSVKQLRNLSEVFPQDEGRYKFFDAAYPYVADAENFGQLQGLLIDPYYINRFKAMLKSN